MFRPVLSTVPERISGSEPRLLRHAYDVKLLGTARRAVRDSIRAHAAAESAGGYRAPCADPRRRVGGFQNMIANSGRTSDGRVKYAAAPTFRIEVWNWG